MFESIPIKRWWIFRTKQTLWGDFLKAKYYQRSNPVSKKRNTWDSLSWKNMLMNRPQVEQHIQWKLQAGNCSFWWDNWLGSGPLTYLTSSNNRLNNSKVADFWEEWTFSLSKLLEQAPVSHLSYILATDISPSSSYQIMQFGNPTHMVVSVVHQLWKRLEKKGPRITSTLFYGIRTFLLNLPFCYGEPLGVNSLLTIGLLILAFSQQLVFAVLIGREWTP